MIHCVVPENIHTLPTEGNGNSEGRGSKKGNFRGVGGGMASWGLFPGAPSKTSELSKTNSSSVEQVLSYLTVNGLLKQEFFFIDEILLKVGWMFFFSSSYSHVTSTPTCICYSWIFLSMRNTTIIHKEYLNLLPITIFSTLNHTESNS